MNPERHIVMCSEEDEKTLLLIKTVLTARQAVDGVVCSVENLAIQAYRVCQMEKLSIPDCVKIIAFSNLQIAGLLAPSMTTVEISARLCDGRSGSHVAFKALTKKADIKKEKVVLPSEIRERDSTR